jgi:diadenylate cyclase
VKRQLLVSLFAPNTPTHDGGAIIIGDRIAACSTIFPLSNKNIPGIKLGTRHRAALGLSEETDCLVIVVSEETGKISLMRDGRIYHDIPVKKLKREIKRLVL